MANRKYIRLTEVSAVSDILGQAAQVLDILSETATEAKDSDNMSRAAALWMELAKIYSEEGAAAEQELEISDLESETEISEEMPPPMGFRP